jgi:hypothetical protein
MDEYDGNSLASDELREFLDRLLAEVRAARERAPRLGVPFVGFLLTMVEDEVVNQTRTIFGDRSVP